MARRRWESHGDTLWQVAPQINGRVDVVRCAVDDELDGEQLGDVDVPHGCRHHGGREVLGRRGSVLGCRGVDGVDVDGHMAVADISVFRIQMGVELDGDDGAVAGAVGVVREEAQAAPCAVARDIWRKMPEEERHPITSVRPRVPNDLEGEGGSEAGRLAGGSIPQRHWLRVLGSADAEFAALVNPVTCI